MSPEEFWTLRRYTMKMAIDENDRDDLVLQAYEEGVRLGSRSSLPLLVNFMKWRSKERNHSFVGVKAGGKSLRDAWSHGMLSLTRPMDEGAMLLDLLGSSSEDPLGVLIVNQFEKALTHAEGDVAKDIVAGYTEKEAVAQLGMCSKDFRRIRQAVRRKAVEHLV